MPAFTLNEITRATGAEIVQSGSDYFTDIVTDTRKLKSSCLFLALKGERFNGEDFAAEAIRRGAAGVIVSRSISEANMVQLQDGDGTVLTVPDTLLAYQQIAHLHRMRFHLPVVAITGSNGKTTTKDLTAAVLSARGPVQKTQANFNNEVGLPLTLLGIRPEHVAAVVEIGMRGLHQIDKLAPLAAPSVGIVTNVGETHMELLGSLENIARAKSELVEAIPVGGTVILNNDNTYVAAMRRQARPGVKVLTFGIEPGPADSSLGTTDIRAEDIRTEGQQTRFFVDYGGERHEYVVPMVGRHNVYNALAAIAAGFALGETPQEIADGLQQLEATKMRFECERLGDWNIVNDAYNASPMSMKAAIETLDALVKEKLAAGEAAYNGRMIAVMGDMFELGSVAESAHTEVGRELAEHGFAAVVTRGELAHHIAEAARTGGVPEVYECDSHEAAAAKLKEILQPGDTVLFKGSRGMQMEKIIDLLG